MNVKSDLEAFYELHMVLVYKYFLGQVGHQQKAEDLTSETFMKACRKWPPKSSDLIGRRAWIFSIARNTLIDYQRSRKNKPNLSLDEDQSLVDAFINVDPNIAEKVALRTALQSLSERDRSLVLMQFIGLNFQEIGIALDMDPGSASKAYGRALKHLKLLLEYKNEEV